ncbi:iron ABC transporter permease [Ferrimonas pelagia]|uniref:Iron chelate uptake ABC transporter family permease subunit n=1 Tax=Ferrimonas pelagia TaxID=1177826 RepID=A0ABP9ED34_9GAMM
MFNQYRNAALLLGLALLPLSLLAGLMLGSVPLPADTLWAVLQGDDSAVSGLIITDLRLPRVLAAALVGAALGLAGALAQTLLRNPLADPYLLGVANGASLMAVMHLLGWPLITLLPLPLAAFIGGLLAFSMVWFCARGRGDQINPLILTLSGIAIAALLSALTTLVMLLGDQRALGPTLRWMLGSLAGVELGQLPLLLVLLIGCAAVAWQRRQQLDALLMGWNKAQTLGVNIRRERLLWCGIIVLLASASVALAGAVSFVGLVVPHLARLLLGPGHRALIPASLLIGALLLIWVDILCRTALAPEELPLGIPMAVLAVPLLLSLLRKQAQ